MEVAKLTPSQEKFARLGKGVVQVLVAIAAIAFLFWTMVTPPGFSGVGGVLVIVYFASLCGVFISSAVWLHRFGSRGPGGKRSQGWMVAALVGSIVFIGFSAVLVFLAVVASGLLNMI